ncbi:MAG TPA: hypothetical protein DDZ80_24860 [Cyanobacteria bacterium UBA8803]|nr:hypothetical protein [Cyanobacteria bacterium UBA9273]HBL61535.1 hypothetical protein [Cyanobacteria bacterium UBA8803]
MAWGIAKGASQLCKCKPKLEELGELGERSWLFLNAAWCESISAKMGCSRSKKLSMFYPDSLMEWQN